MKSKKIFLWVIGVFAMLIVASFLLSEKHENPPVTHTVEWDSPKTKEYFYRACADCHSHETKWPWYSHFAPISQIISIHVKTGRRDFNISKPEMGESKGAAKQVEEDFMPLEDYVKMHPEANFTQQEKQEFISGLKKTFGVNSQK